MIRPRRLAGNALRKCCFFISAVLLFAAPAMRADDGVEYETIYLVGFSIFNPVQFPDSSSEVSGFRLSLVYGKNRVVSGLDISAFVSVVEEDFYGLEGSVLINNIGSSSGALQIAGVANTCYGDCSGLQVAGIANYAEGDVTGGQIGSFNSSKDVSGFQIGAFNVATSVVGCQIGVINVAQTVKGLQIGLINVIKGNDYPCLPLFNTHF